MNPDIPPHNNNDETFSVDSLLYIFEDEGKAPFAAPPSTSETLSVDCLFYEFRIG